jgi:hypothetical protein
MLQQFLHSDESFGSCLCRDVQQLLCLFVSLDCCRGRTIERDLTNLCSFVITQDICVFVYSNDGECVNGTTAERFSIPDSNCTRAILIDGEVVLTPNNTTYVEGIGVVSSHAGKLCDNKDTVLVQYDCTGGVWGWHNSTTRPAKYIDSVLYLPTGGGLAPVFPAPNDIECGRNFTLIWFDHILWCYLHKQRALLWMAKSGILACFIRDSEFWIATVDGISQYDIKEIV